MKLTGITDCTNEDADHRSGMDEAKKCFWIDLNLHSKLAMLYVKERWQVRNS